MEPINIYTTSNANVFYNSKCLFVEYDDVIKMPQFLILINVNENERLNLIFDMSDVRGLPIPALFEWYIHRKHKNIFMNFPLLLKSSKGKTKYQICEEVLQDLLHTSDEFYSQHAELKFASVIDRLSEEKMLVQRIVVYNEYDNPSIKADILSKYGNEVEFVCGRFEDAIKDVTSDSTFVFSDITKVDRLREAGKLNLSSVVIPINFRYNRKEDDKTKWKIDFDTLDKQFTFKHNFFDVFP
jgi:hypothetical protein